MAKFQALRGIRSLYIPWIERNPETGAIIVDRGITFNNGINARTGHVPAYLYTDNPEMLKFLRSDPANSANGGYSFEEVAEPKQEVQAPTVKTAKKEPVQAKELVTVFTVSDKSDDAVDATEEGEVLVFAEITTVQAASAKLRELDETLKVRDTDNKAKVLAVSQAKGISFPNL